MRDGVQRCVILIFKHTQKHTHTHVAPLHDELLCPGCLHIRFSVSFRFLRSLPVDVVIGKRRMRRSFMPHHFPQKFISFVCADERDCKNRNVCVLVFMGFSMTRDTKQNREKLLFCAHIVFPDFSPTLSAQRSV